jgi:hypothetical protein
LQEDVMQTNTSYRPTNVAGSDANEDLDLHGQWLLFTAAVLLATVLVLCAGDPGIDPGQLWPEPSLVGP